VTSDRRSLSSLPLPCDLDECNFLTWMCLVLYSWELESELSLPESKSELESESESKSASESEDKAASSKCERRFFEL